MQQIMCTVQEHDTLPSYLSCYSPTETFSLRVFFETIRHACIKWRNLFNKPPSKCNESKIDFPFIFMFDQPAILVHRISLLKTSFDILRFLVWNQRNLCMFWRSFRKFSFSEFIISLCIMIFIQLNMYFVAHYLAWLKTEKLQFLKGARCLFQGSDRIEINIKISCFIIFSFIPSKL